MNGIYTLEQLQKSASTFVQRLQPLRGRATVVGLYGDLGAGKTTFTQSVAKALGVDTPVSSPTFLIFKRYTLHDSRYTSLVHIDAYRLKTSDELRKLRFDELLADPGNLILVEWADKVTDLLPKDHQKLYFEFVDEHTRRVRT